MFIQVSVSDFAQHNTGSADISRAFNVRDSNGKNQIEKYLDDVYGSGHSACIDGLTNRFIVTKLNVRTPIHIVYIRGCPGNPTHRELVKSFPDVLHVSFEELKSSLFRNIVAASSKDQD
ncbi:hypothetical protein BG003_007207 [Podila horticola]|nr:hypothetical protein BG003_007207 [Podila horticola]